MKITNKLLAFVIACAMVMSVMVMPVSAEVITYPNIAGEVTDITNNKITTTGTVKSPDGADPIWEVIGNATATYTDGVISVTNRKANDATSGIKISHLGLQSGKTYKVSADFRRDAELSTGTSRIRFYFNSALASTNRVAIAGGENINDGVAAAGMLGEIPANVGNQLQPANKGEWYTSAAVFTVGVNEEQELEKGAHIGIKAGQNSNSAEYSYSMKNFKVIEINPLTGAAVSEVEDVAKFTFANNIASATAANFTVTGPEGAKAPSVAVATDGNEVTVTLSNYSLGREYTVTAVAGGVADEFGQKLAEDVSATVTCKSGNLNPAADGNLAPVITGASGNTITYTGGTMASNDANLPVFGAKDTTVQFSYADGVLSVDRQKGESPSGFYLKNLALRSGKTYMVSADFRRDGEVTSGVFTSRFYLEDISGSKATRIGAVNVSQNAANYTIGEITPTVTLSNKDQWYTLKNIFTVGVSETGTKELGMNLGVKVGSNGNAIDFDYSMRNFKLMEVTPFTVDTAVNGNVITLTSSNEFADVTAANFAVTSPVAGASIPTVSVVKEGKVATLTLSNYDYNTLYSIAATNVKDIFNQVYATSFYFSVDSGKPFTPDIMVSGKPGSSSAANGAHVKNIVADGNVYTGEKDLEKYPDGTVGSMQWNGVPYENGKKYVVVGYLKNNDAEPKATATGYVMTSNTGTSGHLYIPAMTAKKSIALTDNEWHKSYGLLELTAKTCDGSCGETCTKSKLGAYAGIQTNKDVNSFSVKDMQVRELKALGTSGYLATIFEDADGSATMYINGPASTIYFAAVALNGNAATDIKFAKADLTAAMPIKELNIAKADNYKIMIWDSNMNPLCNAFLGSEF